MHRALLRKAAWLLQEQQVVFEAENAALAAELSSLNRNARGVETTMRELATLNQMFSTQARSFCSPCHCTPVQACHMHGMPSQYGATHRGLPADAAFCSVDALLLFLPLTCF